MKHHGVDTATFVDFTKCYNEMENTTCTFPELCKFKNTMQQLNGYDNIRSYMKFCKFATSDGRNLDDIIQFMYEIECYSFMDFMRNYT